MTSTENTGTENTGKPEAKPERILAPVSEKAERLRHPELVKALAGLTDAIKAAPAWTTGGKLVKVPAVSYLWGTKDAPATVEKRESTLTRMGMPEAARKTVVAAMVRYHEAWQAAGFGADKATAEAIVWD